MRQFYVEVTTADKTQEFMPIIKFLTVQVIIGPLTYEVFTKKHRDRSLLSILATIQVKRLTFPKVISYSSLLSAKEEKRKCMGFFVVVWFSQYHWFHRHMFYHGFCWLCHMTRSPDWEGEGLGPPHAWSRKLLPRGLPGWCHHACGFPRHLHICWAFFFDWAGLWTSRTSRLLTQLGKQRLHTVCF